LPRGLSRGGWKPGQVCHRPARPSPTSALTDRPSTPWHTSPRIARASAGPVRARPLARRDAARAQGPATIQAVSIDAAVDGRPRHVSKAPTPRTPVIDGRSACSARGTGHPRMRGRRPPTQRHHASNSTAFTVIGSTWKVRQTPHPREKTQARCWSPQPRRGRLSRVPGATALQVEGARTCTSSTAYRVDGHRDRSVIRLLGGVVEATTAWSARSRARPSARGQEVRGSGALDRAQPDARRDVAASSGMHRHHADAQRGARRGRRLDVFGAAAALERTAVRQHGLLRHPRRGGRETATPE